MGSRTFFLMWPQPAEALRPAEALAALAQGGLTFDQEISMAAPVDDARHVDFLRPAAAPGGLAELRARLEAGEQFQVECRNRDLLMVCGFVSGGVVQTFSVWVRTRSFEALPDAPRAFYRALLKRAARHCGAAHVLVIHDPPDLYEDAVAEIDGAWYVDLSPPALPPDRVAEVWTAENLTGAPIAGLPPLKEISTREGFVEYWPAP